MKLKKILAILLIALSALFVLVLSVNLVLAAISDRSPIQAERAAPDELSMNWMSKLSDNLSLSEISIPGTHDSGTKNIIFHYSFQCQDTDITEQLENGFRLLDLRFTATKDERGNDKFCIMHGIGHCKTDSGDCLYFDDVLSDTLSFLDKHPTETVFFLIDQEHDYEDFVLTSRILQKYIAEHSERWFTENRIPLLGECRGKIVLSTRFGDVDNIGETLCGIDLNWDTQGNAAAGETWTTYPINETQSYSVQNHFNYSTDEMWTAFYTTLKERHSEKNNLTINYLSTAKLRLFLPCPKEWARDLNMRLLNTALPDGSYGMVLVDFGTKELAQKIYETNFTER